MYSYVKEAIYKFQHNVFSLLFLICLGLWQKAMDKVIENASLKSYNTFGINAKAKKLCFYENPEDLKDFIPKEADLSKDEILILGGGSNHLFTRDINGTIIHPINNKIEIIKQTGNNVFIKVDAGVNWDTFVDFAVQKSYGGIENLSGIPGNVGASPVQNIGAYGVEVQQVIHSVNLVGIYDKCTKTLSKSECKFSYRNSIFKSSLKNKYIVDSVVFKLSKNPKFTINYGSVENELKNFDEINLENIRRAIINIRDSKLPNPEIVGNAGSFFKNPIISNADANLIKKAYPNIPTYEGKNNTTKLAAGWLIDQCGLKGYSNKKETAGIHNKQALVIINKGNASGNDILEVAKYVQVCVLNKFNISLEPEVIII